MGSDDTDLVERRESMIDILASWALEDALPDPAAMRLIREYVNGECDFAELREKMNALPIDPAV